MTAMDLKTYLEGVDGRLTKGGVELRRLAAALSSSPQVVYLIALGHKGVSTDRAQKLIALTGGRVTLEGLLAVRSTHAAKSPASDRAPAHSAALPAVA